MGRKSKAAKAKSKIAEKSTTSNEPRGSKPSDPKPSDSKPSSSKATDPISSSTEEIALAPPPRPLDKSPEERKQELNKKFLALLASVMCSFRFSRENVVPTNILILIYVVRSVYFIS